MALHGLWVVPQGLTSSCSGRGKARGREDIVTQGGGTAQDFKRDRAASCCLPVRTHLQLCWLRLRGPVQLPPWSLPAVSTAHTTVLAPSPYMFRSMLH